MTEKRFWEIVRKINWSRYWKFDKNCEICRQRMLEACTEDELKEFEDMASAMRSKLEERFKDYYRTISNGEYDYLFPEGFANNYWIGNDTMSDGLWHIVGKGKSIYEKVMKNPNEFLGIFGNVYNMMDTECFSYIFQNNPKSRKSNLTMDFDFLSENMEELSKLAYETFLDYSGFKAKHVRLKCLIQEVLNPYTEDFNEFGAVVFDPIKVSDAIYFPCIFCVHVGLRGGELVNEEEEILTIMGYSKEIGMYLCTTNLIIINQ